MAVVKVVVNKFKVSLKGKPRLWFEMQYPTSADEPKTKEAYEKMIVSFITEHNTIGSTREQQIMAWKTLNWDPVQERLDDCVQIKKNRPGVRKNCRWTIRLFQVQCPTTFVFIS